MEWTERALCKGLNYDFWYPPLDQPNQSDFYAVGRAICERCPVWDQCLTYGAEEKWGMFGGLTPADRKAVLAEKDSSLRPHGSVARYRQGCDCEMCNDAAFATPGEFDISLVPKKCQAVGVIGELLFRLNPVIRS